MERETLSQIRDSALKDAIRKLKVNREKPLGGRLCRVNSQSRGSFQHLSNKDVE